MKILRFLRRLFVRPVAPTLLGLSMADFNRPNRRP